MLIIYKHCSNYFSTTFTEIILKLWEWNRCKFKKKKKKKKNLKNKDNNS